MSLHDWLFLLQNVLLLVIVGLVALGRYEVWRKRRDDRKRPAAAAPRVDPPKQESLSGIKRR
jgi:hypothetical protein